MRSWRARPPSSDRPRAGWLALAAVGLLWLVAAGATAGATAGIIAGGGDGGPVATPVAAAATAAAAPGGGGSQTTPPQDSPQPAVPRPSRGVDAATRVPLLHAPVDGPLVRGFEEPSGRFGPGHRGVDFGAAPGAPVRPPASGRVTFAGLVAGTAWVTIEVAPGVLVTLGPLRGLAVSPGQTVGPGGRLAALAPGHGGRGAGAALHLGLRVDGRYVDPLPWLAGLARPRLAPLPEPGGPH